MNDGLSLLRRIGLGTAQFGFDYGITNRNGRLSQDAISEILWEAQTRGIDLLDTAPAYGDSETVIGGMDPDGVFKIVTKVLPVSANIIGTAEADEVEREFDRSLERLGRSSVEGLLVHHGHQLLAPGGEHLLKRIMKLRETGRVRKIGASIYSAAEIDGILDMFAPDIVQIPISVADQRLITSGHLEKLKKACVEVHARSLFLQGALLSPLSGLPHFFHAEKDSFSRVQGRARETGITALEICLAFANQVAALDRLILGVASVREFAEIVAAAETVTAMQYDLDDLAFVNSDVLDPPRWAARS
ncbi:MAG TPA: aryl-alcohol dehydrogenase [Rhodospirillaceae bacterium]|nr:aryl-alcohol dehydrogenase [Rhodospirillaceae bacterium]|tara:strand:+ start:316 stop:1224 length:909 start_codon:yes stop_codon:yes gene_type:complete